MFVIELENGNKIIEGKDVATWDDVPKDVKIKSVKLTAGGALSKTLTDCERYICYYEGVMKVTQSLNQTYPNPTLIKTGIEAQVLLGIKNYNTWKHKVQALAELEKKAIRESGRTGKLAIDYKDRLLEQLKHKTTEVLKHLNDHEVQVVELRFAESTKSQEQNDQSEKGIRKGIRDNSVVPDSEWILNALRSK